ncbi:hypothetical protein HDE_05232 [Halotydeus destructor]|nr:hypothetical protein HDE_05232 [Halotydeus destructor]
MREVTRGGQTRRTMIMRESKASTASGGHSDSGWKMTISDKPETGYTAPSGGSNSYGPSNGGTSHEIPSMKEPMPAMTPYSNPVDGHVGSGDNGAISGGHPGGNADNLYSVPMEQMQQTYMPAVHAGANYMQGQGSMMDNNMLAGYGDMMPTMPMSAQPTLAMPYGMPMQSHMPMGTVTKPGFPRTDCIIMVNMCSSDPGANMIAANGYYKS